jgi:3-hydroxyacyl-CoA dehydrogenase
LIKKAILANIHTFVDIAKSVKDNDFAIESVFEIMDLERQILPVLRMNKVASQG